LLESYGSKEDSRRQYDVLVPLETPYSETTGKNFFWSNAIKNGLVVSPSGLAIRLFWRLSTKMQPKCRLSPAGLAFRASQVPGPHFFTCSMSSSLSRTCRARLRPRRVSNFTRDRNSSLFIILYHSSEFEEASCARTHCCKLCIAPILRTKTATSFPSTCHGLHIFH